MQGGVLHYLNCCCNIGSCCRVKMCLQLNKYIKQNKQESLHTHGHIIHGQTKLGFEWGCTESLALVCVHACECVCMKVILANPDL